ncbi:hypothetical protein [Cupriavidus necator]|uniref:hypothetical protein n=1 Tax=Cupriavidus necator TaxID=106590 RepID=UPI0030F4681C
MLEAQLQVKQATLITIQEIRHLAGMLPASIDVDVYRQQEKSWLVEFQMGERHFVLSTVRGSVRRWRQLEPILDFLCRHRENLRNIRIHVMVRLPGVRDIGADFILERRGYDG